MYNKEERKKNIKRIILWSIILGAVIALFIPILSVGSVQVIIHKEKLLHTSNFFFLIAPILLKDVNGNIPTLDPCDFGPCLEGIEGTGNVKDASNLIFSFVDYAIYIAFGIGVLMLIYSGWQWAAGSSILDKDGKVTSAQAKETFKNTVIALIIMGLIYLIFRIVLDVSLIVQRLLIGGS